MSTQRLMPGGIASRADLPRGKEGRALCRWCALEVPKGRYTFCSEWCVHEWRMRTDTGYVRDRLLKRDKGVCAICRVNTLSAFLRLKKTRGERRTAMLAVWGLKKMNRRSLWDADHIKPVAEGGGECDLSNYRTLCLLCHRKVTMELRARLAARRVLSESVAASKSDPYALFDGQHQADSSAKQAE